MRNLVPSRPSIFTSTQWWSKRCALLPLHCTVNVTVVVFRVEVAAPVIVIV